MAIDLNAEPFFDDFSEDNKFYRILFRPGYAVQARELTQLQTILQEQVRRHGDHIFKEGSMVIPGQISYDLNLDYVKLTLSGSTAESILSALVGKEIKTAAGLIAKVVAYSVQEGTDPSTIFVKYQNSLQDLVGNNISAFTVGELLTPVDGTSGLDVVVADVGLPVGKGCSATIQRGVYYIKNNFVLVTEQTIILDKYTNTPSYRIGLKLSESIVYPEDDETLLDNALGSPNYSAPGAARYYMDLTLTKLDQNAESELVLGTGEGDTDFIDLLRLKNGQVIFKIDRSQYAELEKTLARRTYDESGDYTLSPFGMEVRDYRNNLRGDWAAGEKFIKGDLIKVSNGGTGFWYFVSVSDGTSGNSRPSFSNTVDSITDGSVKWEYALFPSFNRGINTFTAGATAYSSFTLNDHLRLDGLMCIGVEGGKAYVRGYEIEKLATEYVTLEKSRDLPAGSSALAAYLGVSSLPASSASVSQQKTTSIDLTSGSYVLANNVKYAPDLTAYPEVFLHSVAYGSATTNTVIGKARVRALEKHDTPGQFKVFLFDIIMNAGKNFSEVRSVYTTATAFKADVVLTDSIAVLQNPTNTALVYPLPDYAVKNIVEVSYSVVASFTQTASSGSITITQPTGYTFESVADSDNYIVVDNSTGNIVTPTLNVTGGNLVITGLTSATAAHTVLATIRKSDSTTAQSSRTVTDASKSITTQADAQASVIKLNHSFATRIVSVMMSEATSGGQTTWQTTPVYSVDITNRYTFDINQDVSKISVSQLKLVPGATAPIGPILIKYEYLAVSGSALGNMFSVNSYTNSGLRYDQIPAVGGYSLRDSIDFRPYETSVGTYATRYLPKYGTTASIKYTNYLPRLDNISLTSLGQYVVSQGIPSESPQEPSVPVNSMKMAQLSVEPYTFSRDNKLGVIVNRVENKRYTMRDIGKLERRIQDLEYYTSLTLSELETKSMRIVDSSGFERYQNGFLVDSFDGQGVGNTASDDWNASVDSTKKELRPFFSQKQVSLVADVDQASAGGYKLSGDLVTLPFTETELVAQLKASKTENLNPYALYTWTGIMDINPWSDTWFSTHYRPDIILNDEGQYNAIVAKAEADGILGTVWNSWQTAFSSARSLGARLENLGAWSQVDNEILNSSNNGGTFWRDRATFTTEELNFIGVTDGQLGGQQANAAAGSRVLTIETQAVETTATRTGTRSFIVDKVDSRVLDDRVVDTQVVPYIRPRAVLYTGYGFKPSTRMYGFFDNISVDDYLTPATRLKVTSITNYPSTFDVTRNCGSNVSQPERTVLYSDGVYVSGTVTVTNGSTTVTGSATSFSSQISANDIIVVSPTQRYVVQSVTNNTTLVLKTAYTGTTSSDVSIRVIGPQHITDEIEVAFNHGEVIKEYVGGIATGNSAIVVGQETSGTDQYIYVLNIKGTGSFSTASNAELRAEYPVSSENYEGYVNAYSDLLTHWTTNLQTTMTKAAWGESHWKQFGINEGRTMPAFSNEPPRVKYVSSTAYDVPTTTSTGQLHGIFRIPSNPSIKFRTGTRELRFSDSPSTSTAIRGNTESTSGGAFYQANGLLEIKQRTIVSTRTANIVSEQLSDTNTIVTVSDRLTRDTGWFDPLAQTFMVQQEGGCFITSVDLFFATKDLKVPVRIEIREVVNGYPGSTVLPFSRVEKKPSQVTTSTNASAPTTFKFDSPVFLQNGTEYALVVLSDSNSYTAWISETDTIDVQTGVRISSQPYNGVLFKSQNASAWTADQTQDLKFIIRRASFSQSPVTLQLIPPKLGYKDLGFNPLNFITGSGKCRVEHRNHGMIAGEKVMLKSRQVIDSINGIPASQIFNVEHTILSAELDSYVIEFPTVSTATGKVGGGFITATENYEYQTAMLDIAEVVPAGTSISYAIKTVNHADVDMSQSIVPKENFDFDEVKVYPSSINYTNVAFPTGLAVTATLNPSSSLDSISPVIDLSRIALTMVSNKIDNPIVSEVNDSTLDYFLIANATTLGSSAPIQTADINSDGIIDTIVVNSSSQATLFNNMNNNLNVGDVLRFDYTSVTDSIKYMTITEKSQVGANLYFTLEGVSGETIMDTTSNTVTIRWMSHFKSEYAPVGGSTHSKYVTKKINFSRPSEMLKIMFGAIIPTEAEVEIYYKTGYGVQGDFIATGYKKAIPKSYTKSTGEFTEIVADVENLDPFDSVIVKLVMKSINKAKVPRIKNFRVIAVAA